MVPPNWDHPYGMRPNGREGYQPMFDVRFEDAAREWKEAFCEMGGWRAPMLL